MEIMIFIKISQIDNIQYLITHDQSLITCHLSDYHFNIKITLFSGNHVPGKSGMLKLYGKCRNFPGKSNTHGLPSKSQSDPSHWLKTGFWKNSNQYLITPHFFFNYGLKYTHSIIKFLAVKSLIISVWNGLSKMIDNIIIAIW